MPIVDINGRAVEFPDSLTGEELNAAVKQAAAQLGAPEPVGAGGSFMQGVGDVPAGFNQFMANVLPEGMKPTINAATGSRMAQALPVIGLAARLFGNVLPAQEANEAVTARERDYQARRAAAGATGFDWPRLGGNIAATLPLAAIPAGGSLPAAVGIGAGVGAGMGAIAPQPNAGNDYASRAATSAGLGGVMGAATGALGNLVGRVVAPKIDPNVRALADAGVELTPGQIVGGSARRMEDAATSIPVVGTGVANAQRRSLESFNRSIANEVLKPLGQSVPKDTPAGRVLLTQVYDIISRAYNTALGKVKPFVPDQQFADDFARLMQDRVLMPDQRAFFEQVIKRQIAPRLQAAGEIDGPLLQTVQSELKRMARGYQASQAVPDQELGRALRGLSDLFDDLVARTNPAIAGDIKRANASFARLVRMEAAASGHGATGGVITGPQFAAAVRRGDLSPRRQEFARGTALMQDLADAAKAVLPSTVPDSGTASRSALGLLAGTGVSGMIDPAMAAGYLAATGVGRAAYSEPATAAFRAAALARRPEIVRALGEAARRGGQISGAPVSDLLFPDPMRLP